MVTGLPARRDPCDDKLPQATLVDFRGSNLSDAGSIPAISTTLIDRYELPVNLYFKDRFVLKKLSSATKLPVVLHKKIGTFRRQFTF